MTDWCVVANGGCSTIALQIVTRSMTAMGDDDSQHPSLNISHVVLSTDPRLPFFLQASATPRQAQTAFRRLSQGSPG